MSKGVAYVVPVAELTGASLDWAVAKCEGRVWVHAENFLAYYDDEDDVRYSHSWAQGGPIIEREKINLLYDDFIGEWKTLTVTRDLPLEFGETPLIAAMRCYVASKMGDEIEIPSELL